MPFLNPERARARRLISGLLRLPGPLLVILALALEDGPVRVTELDGVPLVLDDAVDDDLLRLSGGNTVSARHILKVVGLLSHEEVWSVELFVVLVRQRQQTAGFRAVSLVGDIEGVFERLSLLSALGP